MSRDHKAWMLAAVIVAVAYVVRALQPDVPQKYDALLAELFHLPDDAEFVGHEHTGNRGWQPRLSGIVQLTPAQFDDYVAALDDPSVWTLRPFEYGGVTVDGPLSADATRWWDDSIAIITGRMRLFWVDWGGIHGEPPDGGSDVWVEGPRRSLCYAVMGDSYGNRIVPCNSLPANGSRDTLFGPGQRPELYVRGLLDMTERRLFMFVQSNHVDSSGLGCN